VALEDRQTLLDEILPVLVGVEIPDEDIDAMVRGGVGMDRP
jgi:hypothetical protein